MGDKGCQYLFIPTSSKRGQVSDSQVINFKNVYGKPYNLYVDIPKEDLVESKSVFFSLLNNAESISNPEVGADAYYVKSSGYEFRNYDRNVAINCPVYALRNIANNAHVWYSHNREYSWRYWGQITNNGKDINFSNVPDVAVTTINLPVFTRSKWWKIGFSDSRIICNVREVQIYFQDEEIVGINFYHHKNQDVYNTPNTDTAPHLQNQIVDGSYYVLTGDSYIGFELPTIQSFDKIVLYHDYLTEYECSHNKAGIDSSTSLCIHCDGEQGLSNDLKDDSYYERIITTVGSGIYHDRIPRIVSYSFTEDFSYCAPVEEDFSSGVLDPSLWTDLVNASVVDEKLHITNSGIIGEITTTNYYYGDFDVRVDLDIDGASDNQGWGCYLEAHTITGEIVRVGKYYHYSAPHHMFISKKFNIYGWNEIDYEASEYTDNLSLRIARDGSNVNFYTSDIASNGWYDLGSVSDFGTRPVKFKLVSDLTPFATEITTAKFDNFDLSTEEADWGTNTECSSLFTCRFKFESC